MKHQQNNPATHQHHTNNNDNQSETSTQPDQPLSPQTLTHNIIHHHHAYQLIKIKTSLCKNYMQTSFCPYAGKCQFAHGPQELKMNMEYNRSYKTKRCHAFNQKGHCVYGNRCNFIHQDEPNEETVGLNLKLLQWFGVQICEIQYGTQSQLMRILRQQLRN